MEKLWTIEHPHVYARACCVYRRGFWIMPAVILSNWGKPLWIIIYSDYVVRVFLDRYPEMNELKNTEYLCDENLLTL